MTQRKRKNNQPTPKKKCQGERCNGKEKAITYFFKVDSPMFPDGMLNICRDCVRAEVDCDEIDQVIGFLRQIDKPYIESYWNEAYNSGRHPLGEYIRKINSLSQMKGKTFDNSDGMQNSLGNIDLTSARAKDAVENVKGELIEYTDELVDKWGLGYKKQEYLKLEKFYQDMKLTHEINTPVHINKLMELAYLTIEMGRLRQERNMGDYTKLANTIDKMEQSAGFRPVDRQGIDDATGIKSFSQIWEQVEKRGFRKPPVLEFDEDIVDQIIISLSNYYHAIVGKQLLESIPEDVREELDDFYAFDDTPVELNDEEYENLDFSIDEMELDDDLDE